MGAAQSTPQQQQAELDEALLRAVKSGDEAAVTSLHAAGASLEPSTGLTPLAAACDRPVEAAGMARLLLRLGADPDKGGAAAALPAQLAAARGHADTVAALLAAGADGAGVVEAARARGHAAVVRAAERELGGEARRQRQQQQGGNENGMAAAAAAAADGQQQQQQAARRMQWIGLIIEAAALLAKALWQVLEVRVHVDLTEKAPENAPPDAGAGASGASGTGGGGGSDGKKVNVKVRLGVQVPLEALDTPGAAPAPGSKSISVTYNCANAAAPPAAAAAAAATSPDWQWWSSSAAAASSSSSRAAAAQGPQPAAAGAAPAGGGGSSRSTSSSGTRAASSAPPAPPAAAARPSAPSAPPMPPHLDDDTRVAYPAVDTSPVDAAAASAPEAGEEEEGRCLICCDAQAEAACVPCGHLVGCMNCLAGIRARGQGCPVCRAPIQQLLRVFQG